MSKNSRATFWRSVPFTVVAVAIVVLGLLAPALGLGGSTAVVTAHGTVAYKGDPDIGGSKAGRIKEKNHQSYQQQQYAIRAYPGTSIPDGGYSNATAQYNLVNDYTFPGGWQEQGPRFTPNANFFIFGLYPTPRTTVSGRSTAMVADPRTCSSGTCQTMYLGTANGGVWKSINGGQNWSAIFDHQMQTSVSTIVLDPVNPSIVYVGTGEDNFSGDSQQGVGIYRSLDGGNSWTNLGFSYFVNRAVSRIVVDPRTSKGAGTTHATLYVTSMTATIGCAATSDTCTTRPPGRPPLGFWYSTDGGSTFTQANPGDVGPSQRATDLMVDPSNPNVLYVAFAFYGIYRTTTDALPLSGGFGNWARLPGQPGPFTFERVLMDFARSTVNQTPQILYANYNMSANTSTGTPDCNLTGDPNCAPDGPLQVYKIQIANPTVPNGAAAFTALPNPYICGSPPFSQCIYDMPIRVDPTNPNVLYVGGQANYDYVFGNYKTVPCGQLYPLPRNCSAVVAKSTDGGQTWRDISYNVNGLAIHPDDHYLYLPPNDPSTLWTMNDGGVFQASGANTPNGSGDAGAVNWTDRNPGIGTLQFTGVGVGPTNSVWGGTQDNGTFLMRSGSNGSTHILLGDGGQGVADPFNAGLGYSEQYGATMFRFMNPTCDFQPGPYPEGYPACGSTWIAPFSGDTDFYGGGNFYQPQTTAFKNPNGTQASNNIFHGTFRVWRSMNYGGVDTNNDGDVTNDPAEQQAHPSYWLPISGSLGCGPTDVGAQGVCADGTFAGNIEWMEVAPNDPNTMVVSVGPGLDPNTGQPTPRHLYVTHNALAPVVTDQGANYCPPTTFDAFQGTNAATCNYVSGPTWKEIDSTLVNRVVTSIAFAPHSTTHYYVAVSGFGANTPGNPYHVFETTNDGATWTPINGTGPQFSLPDMPFNSIRVNQNTGSLYAAADIGVFVSTDNGAHWMRNDYGLPNVPVEELALNPNSSQLYAATHGRGVWYMGAP